MTSLFVVIVGISFYDQAHSYYTLSKHELIYVIYVIDLILTLVIVKPSNFYFCFFLASLFFVAVGISFYDQAYSYYTLSKHELIYVIYVIVEMIIEINTI